MVDTKQAMESEFVTVDLVKSSPTKKLVVVEPGSYEESEFGTRLTVKVNIDGTLKRWRPNKESVENMQVYGSDTTEWVQKIVNLKIEKRSGKECVIAMPEAGELTPQQKQESILDEPVGQPILQPESQPQPGQAMG